MNPIGLDFTDVHTTAEFKLGSVFGDVGTSGPQKCYKYVRYDSGVGNVAAVAGQVAYYHTAGGTETSVVTSDVSDSVRVGAGVLQSAPADGQYCWVQVSGPATLSIALTAGSDGNALTPVGAGDGTLDVSAAATDDVCAIADDISERKIICRFAH